MGLILGLNGFAQISFVEGYYINNFDVRTDCLIKNVDWLNNPTEFQYKVSENSDEKTLTINSVKEFGIFNISKYVRHKVDIDRSSAVVNEIDHNKKPVFNKEQLFLKLLIEGKANLYLYENRGLRRYFFSQDLMEVKQLIFKNYLLDNGQIAQNNEFRRQLWNTLKCESISMNQLGKLNYKQSDLTKFFISYHECSNSEFTNYQKKQKKDLFNLTLRPGIRSSSLELDGPIREPFDFDEGLTSFRFGLEAEFILGFNNNKWAILLEPTYQHFESEATTIANRTTGEESIANVNHESIQVNSGLRYYIFLNKDLKLFANVLGVIDINLDSSIEVTRKRDGDNTFTSEIQNGVGAALGIGCKYKEKYNLELRHVANRNLLNTEGSWGTKFSSIALILGYSLF
ncbi:tRNA modification GTPase [Algibacter mikhailovii]|uniref:tRNA modification GTPase n=1 Tax=Algibacter mikhailovii TaxID=425498 RepID=UPI002493DE91|nr:tRNA modification GTPase [Algibacter mikhailovii]